MLPALAQTVHMDDPLLSERENNIAILEDRRNPP
jgi:hypothetical protein